MKLAPLALAVVGGLLAVPACDKKKDLPPAAGGGDPSAGGYVGSKGGPPGGIQPAPSGGGRVLTSAWSGALLTQAHEQTQANLKQIGLALHHSLDAHLAFPAGIYDKSGKAVGLSWRVAILPYIEQENLFKSFKLDEPWDSEHNKKLLPQMPKIYQSTGNTEAGYTFYRGFTGKGMMFEPPTKPGQPGMVALGRKILDIKDGTSITAMVVEGAESVPWTKPDTLDVDPKNPLASVGGVFEGVFYALRCDGSWTPVKKTITGTTLRDFAVINDGKTVDLP